MDAEKTGRFIAELRGELGLTQRELAEKIGVTDKAVSKWERGRGFPDVAILETLSKELGVSIAELISGERATPETAAEQSNSALVETLLYVKRMSRKIVGTLIIIFGACLLGSPLVFAGFYLPLYVMGIIVTAGGIFMLVSKKSFANWGFPKIALEGISLAALASAIFLEIQPNGVVMWWWTPPDIESKYTLHSYFDMLPFGYGIFPPFITAMLTVAVTVFSVIVMLLDKRFAKPRNALFVCIIVAVVISVCPVLYGVGSVTMTGVLITLALVISAAFRAAANAR
ncbi:MAG: helix-turn-helix domain-containing protein [Oscillospiraceae bacterium]|nr:helix-turn-helix domain-containing protein [Oscillospiraceae bacterium]